MLNDGQLFGDVDFNILDTKTLDFVTKLISPSLVAIKDYKLSNVSFTTTN